VDRALVGPAAVLLLLFLLCLLAAATFLLENDVFNELYYSRAETRSCTGQEVLATVKVPTQQKWV
jgi:hypothetical protein